MTVNVLLIRLLIFHKKHTIKSELVSGEAKDLVEISRSFLYILRILGH